MPSYAECNPSEILGRRHGYARRWQAHYPEDCLLYGLAVVLAIALIIGWLIGFGALRATLTHRLL